MSIENLKLVVGFGLKMGEALIDASQQTTTIARAGSMLHLAEDLPTLFSIDYSKLSAEAKSLSSEQLTDLNSFIDANFSIADADKESKIEAAIGVVIDLVKVIERAISIWGK